MFQNFGFALRAALVIVAIESLVACAPSQEEDRGETSNKLVDGRGDKTPRVATGGAAQKEEEEGEECGYSKEASCAKGYMCRINAGEGAEPSSNDGEGISKALLLTGKCEEDPCAADPSSCSISCSNGKHWDEKARACVNGAEVPDCNNPNDKCQED